MGDIGRRSGVGRTTLARLIREESAFNAVHHSSTNATSHHLRESEGILDDDLQDMRHSSDVHHDNVDSQEEVANGHQRDEKGTDTGYAVNAPEDNNESQHSDDGTNSNRRQTKGLTHGSTDGVGLCRVVGQSEGKGDEDGEEDGHPSATVAQGFPRTVAHTLADIIGRTTNKVITSVLLEELAEGGLHKSGSAPDKCHHPHPEDGTRTSDGNSCSHTR